MSALHRLGSWVLPSGNSVDAYHRPVADGLSMLVMAWDSPPPPDSTDFAFYEARIRPDAVARACEYVETLDDVLVVGR